MANPYDSHPLYRLRRDLVILAIFSFVLGSIAAAGSRTGGDPPIWTFHLLWTFCSLLLCIYDLIQYALEKARDPEAETSWPSKKIMNGDAILTVLFVWLFVLESASLDMYYSSTPLTVYASVITCIYL
jgi:hypothetical protein